MREMLDRPSEQTLRQFSEGVVSEIEDFLSDVRPVPRSSATDIQSSRPNLPPHPVLDTFFIDVFSIDPTARGNRPSSSPDDCSNSTLFPLTPLNRSLRVFPRHLHPAKTGAAGLHVAAVLGVCAGAGRAGRLVRNVVAL
jgi:hypothetical protein